MTSINIFTLFIKSESGDLAIDGADKEVNDFRNELLGTAADFENLRKSVNAQEAASGKARGAALKMKMASLAFGALPSKKLTKFSKEINNDKTTCSSYFSWCIASYRTYHYRY